MCKKFGGKNSRIRRENIGKIQDLPWLNMKLSDWLSHHRWPIRHRKTLHKIPGIFGYSRPWWVWCKSRVVWGWVTRRWHIPRSQFYRQKCEPRPKRFDYFQCIKSLGFERDPRWRDKSWPVHLWENSENVKSVKNRGK